MICYSIGLKYQSFSNFVFTLFYNFRHPVMFIHCLHSISVDCIIICICRKLIAESKELKAGSESRPSLNGNVLGQRRSSRDPKIYVEVEEALYGTPPSYTSEDRNGTLYSGSKGGIKGPRKSETKLVDLPQVPKGVEGKMVENGECYYAMDGMSEQGTLERREHMLKSDPSARESVSMIYSEIPYEAMATCKTGMSTFKDDGEYTTPSISFSTASTLNRDVQYESTFGDVIAQLNKAPSMESIELSTLSRQQQGPGVDQDDEYLLPVNSKRRRSQEIIGEVRKFINHAFVEKGDNDNVQAKDIPDVETPLDVTEFSDVSSAAVSEVNPDEFRFENTQYGFWTTRRILACFSILTIGPGSNRDRYVLEMNCIEVLYLLKINCMVEFCNLWGSW